MAENDLTATSLATEGTESVSSGNGQTAEGNQTQAAETAGAEEGLKFEGFSEEERGKLTRFKSHNELAKSYLDLERKLGATVQLPGRNASAEERTAFFKKLGRPESVADYELETVYLPETAVKIDLGDAEFREVALRANLTKEQARELHRYAAQGAVKMILDWQDKARAAATAAEAKLREELGANYDQKKAQLPSAWRKYDRKDDLIQWLNEGAGNDPRLVRFLMWVGDQFGEDVRFARGKPVPPVTVDNRQPGQLAYPDSPELVNTARR